MIDPKYMMCSKHAQILCALKHSLKFRELKLMLKTKCK